MVAQFVRLQANNIEVNYQCFKRFIVVSFEGRLLPMWQDKVTVMLVVIRVGAKKGQGGLAPQSTCFAPRINKLTNLKTTTLGA